MSEHKTHCQQILRALKKGEKVPPLSSMKAGDRFGAYIFVERIDCRKAVVDCAYCGSRKTIYYYNASRSKSCGCRTKEILRAARITHGHSKVYGKESPTHKSWRSMMERCERPAHKSYGDYGGRGIAVCERWRTFENFLADMGERPAGKTLGRIENDVGYDPRNCEWQTYKEQANNRRNSALLTFRGRTQTLMQWSDEIGIRFDALQRRLALGWSVEKTLTTPPRQQRNSRSTWREAA